MLLHDNDNKMMIIGEDGILYYQDMNKQKLISEFVIDKDRGVVDIHPETKYADTTNYKTFKAISPDSIFQIDPRLEKGT